MRTFASLAEMRILEFDEVADPAVFRDLRMIAQMAHRSDGRPGAHAALHDLAGVDADLIRDHGVAQK